MLRSSRQLFLEHDQPVYSDGALANAQKLQQSFFAATGTFLPIIRLALSEAEAFSYAPEDQTTVPTRQ